MIRSTNGHDHHTNGTNGTNGGGEVTKPANHIVTNGHHQHDEEIDDMTSQDDYDQYDDDYDVDQTTTVAGQESSSISAYHHNQHNHHHHHNHHNGKPAIKFNSSYAFGEATSGQFPGDEENVPKKIESTMLTDHDGKTFEAYYLVSNGPGTGGSSGGGNLNYSLAPSISGKKKMFYCQTCPYKTNNYCNLKQHLVQHRFRDGFFKCRYCPYYVSMIRLLKQHEILHGEYIPRDNIKREAPLSPHEQLLIQQQQSLPPPMRMIAAAGAAFSFPK